MKLTPPEESSRQPERHSRDGSHANQTEQSKEADYPNTSQALPVIRHQGTVVTARSEAGRTTLRGEKRHSFAQSSERRTPHRTRARRSNSARERFDEGPDPMHDPR